MLDLSLTPGPLSLADRGHTYDTLEKDTNSCGAILLAGDTSYASSFSGSFRPVLPHRALALAEESRARPYDIGGGVLARNNNSGLSTAIRTLEAVNTSGLKAFA